MSGRFESGTCEERASISPTPSVIDLNRRGGCGTAGSAFRPRRLCDAVFAYSKTFAPRRRYYAFFLRPPLRFAVLRAVFFAADFVFDFAFFAILPS
jgi:hypothetical protein